LIRKYQYVWKKLGYTNFRLGDDAQKIRRLIKKSKYSKCPINTEDQYVTANYGNSKITFAFYKKGKVSRLYRIIVTNKDNNS